ncbi:hypothetical protein APA_1991 [Pseudanabaena sp. lw0831]|nr:hypothetical protein APA_1991 [Pseudanabaena sp. lw0831]
MFDAIAHESPVDDSGADYGLESEDLEESREIFWSRDSSAASIEPPSTAIVEVLRQRQFEDWGADETENWLEQIALLVGDFDLLVRGDRLLQLLQPQVFKPLSEFTLLEKGGKQLVIPHKNVNEEREQLKLF